MYQKNNFIKFLIYKQNVALLQIKLANKVQTCLQKECMLVKKMHVKNKNTCIFKPDGAGRALTFKMQNIHKNKLDKRNMIYY